MHKAIFIDRDGTISEEVGYMYDASLYKTFSYSGPAIRRINESGMKAVLITNQSGVGRGYFDEAMVHRVHDILNSELRQHGARLDAIYYCPHAPDAGCECRKPQPGLLRRAERELNIDLNSSYVIGDKHVDVATAYSVGARAVMVMTGYGRTEYEAHKADPQQPHYIASDLVDAVDAILSGAVG
jgi:D-glycero-D-manno-heptose 1,7-bisphosphate phosphatase